MIELMRTARPVSTVDRWQFARSVHIEYGPIVSADGKKWVQLSNGNRFMDDKHVLPF